MVFMKNVVDNHLGMTTLLTSFIVSNVSSCFVLSFYLAFGILLEESLIERDVFMPYLKKFSFVSVIIGSLGTGVSFI
jgi:hypothetical protein